MADLFYASVLWHAGAANLMLIVVPWCCLAADGKQSVSYLDLCLMNNSYALILFRCFVDIRCLISIPMVDAGELSPASRVGSSFQHLHRQ